MFGVEWTKQCSITARTIGLGLSIVKVEDWGEWAACDEVVEYTERSSRGSRSNGETWPKKK